MARLIAELDRAVVRVTAKEDASTRAHAATQALEIIGKAAGELTAIRDAAALELAPGRSHAELGRLLGVHKSRVGQILKRAGNGQT